MVKGYVGGTEAIGATSYYRAFRDITTGAGTTSFNEVFFRNQGETGTTGNPRNDLGSQGLLPENKSGDITGIFLRLRMQPITPAGAEQSVKIMEALRDLDLTLLVNGSEIVKQPVWSAGHPPQWSQGSYIRATTADGSTFSTQNSGFMMMFTPHLVLPRQSIQVVLSGETTTATGTVTSGNYWNGTTDRIKVECCIQVVDKKAV